MIESEYQQTETAPPETFPWPPRENESFLEALATTWKDSLFRPKSFFARMPVENDFGWVLGYYLILVVVGAGISLFWRMVLGPSPFERALLEQGGTPGNPVVDFLLTPLWAFIALFVYAGVLHLCLLMVRGANRTFSTTARVISFTGGTNLFLIVPYLGLLIATIWSLIVTVIGLREAHQTTTGRAIAAIAIPIGFIMLLGVLAAILVVALGLSAVSV